MFGRLLLTGLQGATLAARGAMALRAATAPRPRPVPAEGPLRIVMFAQYPTRYAGTKYRLAKWAERLRVLGHRVDVIPPMPDRHAERFSYDWRRSARAEYHLRLLAARTKAVFGSVGADVAILHMNDLPFWEYGAPFVARSLKRIVGRVLLDMDDLPVIASEGAIRPRVRELASTVDGLIVGNRRILEHLPTKPSWFVPTCIDPDEWPASGRAPRSGPVVLGWVGTPGNMVHLEPLAAPLEAVCRMFGARVRVICSEPPVLPGVPVDFVRWSAEREVDDILPIDVGLAPLRDGPSERCKCALKALQYMAAGSAVLASPVGANADVVRDGVTGFLVADDSDWVPRLEEILSLPDRGTAMGREGAAVVARSYSFVAHQSTFNSALRGVPTIGSESQLAVRGPGPLPEPD